MTTLKELKASAAKLGETVYNNFCPGSSPVKALWENGKKKATEIPRSTGRKFLGQPDRAGAVYPDVQA